MPRRGRKLRLLALLALAALLLPAVVSLLRPPPLERRGQGRAALVIDALYEWTPNDTLLRSVVEILSRAGYSVRVVKGREATVDSFRNITLYDLVIVRCHGAYFKAGDSLGGRVLADNAPIVFTGEVFTECLPFSCKYFSERLGEEVVRGEFAYGNRTVSVFALTPLFFERLQGGFRRGAVVIVASCYGLTGRLLADALLGKGASVFISWDWKVSPEVMDAALRMLLEEALLKGRGWPEAVEAVDRALGPDPLGGGRLKAVARGA